jgi:MinD-like ATPase involved in chromosome partitioning or flagellar assembly
MQEKVAPVMVRKPDCPAAQEITKIASRITGLKASEAQNTKKVGFLEKLFSIFRKK